MPTTYKITQAQRSDLATGSVALYGVNKNGDNLEIAVAVWDTDPNPTDKILHLNDTLTVGENTYRLSFAQAATGAFDYTSGLENRPYIELTLED